MRISDWSSDVCSSDLFSHSLSLLMSAFSLPIPPGGLTTRPSQAYGTLRYHACKHDSSASAGGMSPGTSSAQAGLSSPVSYYAFFKGWMVSSQPHGCHGFHNSFQIGRASCRERVG